MSNHIAQFYADEIIYPCPQLDADLKDAPVPFITQDVNQSLPKPQLKLNGGFTKLVLTYGSQLSGHKASW